MLLGSRFQLPNNIPLDHNKTPGLTSLHKDPDLVMELLATPPLMLLEMPMLTLLLQPHKWEPQHLFQ